MKFLENMQNHIQINKKELCKTFSLSIVIPNYNETCFLKESINSVLNQTIKPNELIILDDASTTESVEIAMSCIDGVDFAKVVCNAKNLGYGGVENTNKGLRMATSDYIAFLSANDYLEKNFIEIISDAIKCESDIGIVSCLSNGVDESGRVYGLLNAAVLSLKQRMLSATEVQEFITSGGSWIAGIPVYKRDYLLKIGGFEKNLYGLCDLVSANAIAMSYGAIFIPKPLVNLRKHQNSLLECSLTDRPTLKAILASLRAAMNKRVGFYSKGDLFVRKLIKRILAASFLRTGDLTIMNEPEISSKVLKVLLYSKCLPIFFQKIIVILALRWGEIISIIKYRIINYLLLVIKINFIKI
jgi:glycosyltransferase involved in cell wall biosynthesis